MRLFMITNCFLFSFLLFLVFPVSIHAQSVPDAVSGLENVTIINLDNTSKSNVTLGEPLLFSDENLIMGRIAGVAVDDKGQVYIADSDNTAIYQFDRNGNYLRSAGAAGDGPGEFRMIRSIEAGHGYLHVMDLSQRRITRFSLDNLEFAGTVSMSGNQEQMSGGFNMSRFPNQFLLMPDGNYLLTFSAMSFPGMGGSSNEEPKMAFDILTPEGELLGLEGIELRSNETITTASGGNFRIIMPPYGKKGLAVVTADGAIYTNWSEEALFKEYDTGGNYRQSLFIPYQKPPLNREELLAKTRETMDDASFELFREQKFPAVWPAVNGMLPGDNGTLWISLNTRNQNENKWVVIDRKGHVKGTFLFPNERRIQRIKDGFIYTIEPDEDGFSSVKRYRINL